MGYPKWTWKDIEHLIRNCDPDGEMKCRCELHHEVSPFTAFPQAPGVIDSTDADEVQTETTISPLPRLSSFVDADVWGESESSQRQGQVISGGLNRSDLIIRFQHEHLNAPIPDTVLKTSSGKLLKRCRNLNRRQDVLAVQPTNSIWLFSSQLTPFLNINATPNERRLFHHYLSYLAKGMIPIRDERNPWETVYPLLATRCTHSIGARALYHGLLAQSAHHLANLKGVERGTQERATAVRQYGMALRLLRQSLSLPSEDYSTVLAAIITILLTEHVLQGTSIGWQDHICGAWSFVKRFLDKQPWKSSPEAFTITQNFALSVMISSTVDIKILAAAPADGISELDNLLHDLVAMPLFGYTLGGTAHMLAAMNRTRLLEAHMRAMYGDVKPSELDSDIVNEVDEILQLCHVSLKDKVEAYVAHRIASGVTVDFRMRTLTELHLRLFNNGVIIYLLCTVLRFPPFLVASQVLQVLNDAAAFFGMHRNTVSIWPVFIAAAEAYTPEAQALATHCLEFLIGSGLINRRNMLYIIHRVWCDRSQLAREGRCRPGNVSVDWRQVMHELHTHILLL